MCEIYLAEKDVFIHDLHIYAQRQSFQDKVHFWEHHMRKLFSIFQSTTDNFLLSHSEDAYIVLDLPLLPQFSFLSYVEADYLIF